MSNEDDQDRRLDASDEKKPSKFQNEKPKDILSAIAGGIQSSAQNYEDSKRLKHARTLNDLSNEAVRNLEITKKGLILQEELENFEDIVNTAAEQVRAEKLAAEKSRRDLESEIANQEAQDAVRKESFEADLVEQKLRKARAEAELAKLQNQKTPLDELQSQIDHAEKKLHNLVLEKAEAETSAGGVLSEAVERHFNSNIEDARASLERLKSKLENLRDDEV